ncbi:MAG: phosphoserine phosphatase RsbU/P [Thermodesulfobacteriota bacterium]|nr:phosphoserine phosphatase RsbU/P [Thermodesulfobacteriota bacterium]
MPAVFKNRGIAFRLVFLILISDAAIFVCIFGYNYRVSRQIIEKDIRANARNLVMATVNRIDTALLPVEKIPENLAYFLENSPPLAEEELKGLLRAIVENNPDIYGAAIAFEPRAFGRDTRCQAPYYCKSGDSLRFTCLGSDSYRYFLWDWYRIPQETRHPVWSEPYYDRGGGDIVMATYSVPFYQTVSGERRFMGVVTADISLSWLTDIISSIKTAESGYAFLVSKKGHFLAHPQTDLVLKKTIFDEAMTRNDPDLYSIGMAMTEGKTGFSPLTSMVTGKACWIAYAPLASSNWSLGVLFPQDELTADITRLNHVVWTLGLFGFLLLAGVMITIASSITRPLRDLATATEGIAAGNLDVPLPPIKFPRDEVGMLTDAFARMVDSLKRYIRDLTETTAQKERIESELRVARDIQMGMLPKALPPVTGILEFDIYATLEPARQVGGDLYDFFLVDDDHLCFTIGDVAGKGVSAALFMTVTQTLNKTKAIQGRGPGEILSSVNKDLSVENPSFMFVTVFMGILNIRTGDLEFSNGGHNPPYLIRTNGTIEALELTDGLALGIEGDFSYLAKKTSLRTGDTVFLYTDGVTEAMNQKKELFTQKRLEQELSIRKNQPLDRMATGIMGRVKAFSEGEPQADDITMLIVRFHGQGDQGNINAQ